MKIRLSGQNPLSVHSLAYARGQRLAEETHIGNFVEIKSYHRQGSKVNHLTYVGDAEIGKECNIGAGVITCNYDGANKFKAIIGDNVFVGSDSQLIARSRLPAVQPLVPVQRSLKTLRENELVISRVPQRHIQGSGARLKEIVPVVKSYYI